MVCRRTLAALITGVSMLCGAHSGSSHATVYNPATDPIIRTAGSNFFVYDWSTSPAYTPGIRMVLGRCQLRRGQPKSC